MLLLEEEEEDEEKDEEEEGVEHSLVDELVAKSPSGLTPSFLSYPSFFLGFQGMWRSPQTLLLAEPNSSESSFGTKVAPLCTAVSSSFLSALACCFHKFAVGDSSLSRSAS